MNTIILHTFFYRRKHSGRGLVSIITKQASRACPRINRSGFPECGLTPFFPPLEGKPQARRIFRSRFSHRSFRNSTPTPPVPVLAPVSHRVDRYASDPPFSLSPDSPSWHSSCTFLIRWQFVHMGGHSAEGWSLTRPGRTTKVKVTNPHLPI